MVARYELQADTTPREGEGMDLRIFITLRDN